MPKTKRLVTSQIVITPEDVAAYLADPVYCTTHHQDERCATADQHEAVWTVTWACGCVYHYCDRAYHYTVGGPSGRVRCTTHNNLRVGPSLIEQRKYA